MGDGAQHGSLSYPHYTGHFECVPRPHCPAHVLWHFLSPGSRHIIDTLCASDSVPLCLASTARWRALSPIIRSTVPNLISGSILL